MWRPAEKHHLLTFLMNQSQRKLLLKQEEEPVLPPPEASRENQEELRHLLRLQEQAYRRLGNKRCSAEAEDAASEDKAAYRRAGKADQ